ncbi:RNA polymerase factor sigma-54 [Planococcus salinus]|uniref:RNA polymerase sigma-54 factor n=1 Tax=Planococcus salinus TaxID=1848460 RepID=A0A3M8P9D3_9BACL|nr:RNA polymerase factor sigma-54 [Planococcus salinus]RNF40222.1 RNA polymerase sigma-54 factor [Planococcus salinus]
MELVLQQRQELSLRMTTELRQAIELLQYSTYDLYQFIKEQELENPLIKLEEKKVEWAPKEHRGKIKSANTAASAIDSISDSQLTMREKLVEQAQLVHKNAKDQQLAKFLIYNLDDNGYLPFPEEEEATEISYGIQLLQRIGPSGIGARSLKECLLLQLKNDFPGTEVAQRLIQNHLPLLADRKWAKIASLMEIPLSEVKEIHELILQLNPKPCSCIADFSVEYINPDIIVERKKGELSFRLNDNYLPNIRFNNDYSNLLSQKDETSKYITSQYNNYQWLLNSIEQRRQTITKVVKVILEKQRDFFTGGFADLQPLTLKEIAEEIDMHESTISRATANKAIQTPKGTFDLRLFFTSKLETATGDTISQTKVKALLKTLIADENKSKPLSDQKITDHFNQNEGITISRRTITKYREEMNIPSSSKRKKITA